MLTTFYIKYLNKAVKKRKHLSKQMNLCKRNMHILGKKKNWKKIAPNIGSPPKPQKIQGRGFCLSSPIKTRGWGKEEAETPAIEFWSWKTYRQVEIDLADPRKLNPNWHGKAKPQPLLHHTVHKRLKTGSKAWRGLIRRLRDNCWKHLTP